MATVARSDQTGPVVDRPNAFPWIAFLWYAAMLVIAFGPVLGSMIYQWESDDDAGHGFFVVLIAAYIIWERRKEWLTGEAERNIWGLAVVAVGAIQLWLGTLGTELFLQRTAFLICVVGLVLFHGGRRALRILAFPLLLLVFMVPIPGIVSKQITFPLQLVASSLAENLLGLFGYMVLREGNVLELAGQELSVVEACSGLRAVHSLLFFSLTYAYIFDSRVWIRWFLLFASIPAAIVSNASRIVFTGVIGEYNRELAVGVYHTASGWLLYVIAILIMAAAHYLTRPRWSHFSE